MSPKEENTHYHVNDRIQYLGSVDSGVPAPTGELRPGEIGIVIEDGNRGSVLVWFPSYRGIRVKEADKRFRKLRVDY